VKQIIVVNESLRLPRGKLAAQVAHASIGAFLSSNSGDQVEWLSSGMTKIVLACESAQALLELRDQAQAAGLPAFVVEDAGRTVVAAGTVTCLGIGPAADDAIATVTGALRLL
jgi:peptidyl-tRNA hydrolase